MTVSKARKGTIVMFEDDTPEFEGDTPVKLLMRVVEENPWASEAETIRLFIEAVRCSEGFNPELTEWNDFRKKLLN